MSDLNKGDKGMPGMYAVRFDTGEKLWGTPAPEGAGVKAALAAVGDAGARIFRITRVGTCAPTPPKPAKLFGISMPCAISTPSSSARAQRIVRWRRSCHRQWNGDCYIRLWIRWREVRECIARLFRGRQVSAHALVSTPTRLLFFLIHPAQSVWIFDKRSLAWIGFDR